MKKIKDSFTAKVIAFILVILLSVTVAFSVIIVMVNAEGQWYSKGKRAVKEDIYERTADYAAELLTERIMEDYDSDSMEADGNYDTEEMINEESNSPEFGYTITYNTDYYAENPSDEQSTSITRTLHENLKDREDIYKKTVNHSTETIEVYLGEITESGVPTSIYTKYHVMDNIYRYRYGAIASGVTCGIALLCLVIFLLTTVGRKDSDRSVIRKVPLEIVLAAAVIAFLFMGGISTSVSLDENVDLLCVIVAANIVVTVTSMLGASLAVAIKMRQKNLWESSITHKVFIIIRYAVMWIVKTARKIPMVWKASLAAAVMLLAGWLILTSSWFVYDIPFLWYVWCVLIFVLVIHIASGMKKLRTGARHFAEGDFSYHIEERGLVWDMAEHARDLNSIGNGIAKAVEEKTRSERFKNELITNVSHDIKTPLTTIINYVDFLKKEDIDNEKAQEYIEVLDRQSKRLKKLTEDLIEASKAATGNIKLDMMPCQVGVLMTQTSGEYKEKLESQDLNLITSFPEKDIEIMADGRSMWRIFDNILNNICKYSQPGTRVYQTLERKSGKAVITYKNTSSYELNISEEELMERFVRGDSSRHTEGSGLGLSIAKNLVKLQGGTLDIFIDGDLFKVVIQFDINGDICSSHAEDGIRGDEYANV